jgi:hypothetical protein
VRKLLSILFLGVFLFNIIGYYPVYLLRQSDIRNEVAKFFEQNFSKGELVVLSFDAAESRSLIWTDKNEFRYKGEMFDVMMKKTDSDGRLYFYCYSDQKEKKLEAGLDRHVNSQTERNTGNKQDKNDMTKNFLKEYFGTENNVRFAALVTDVEYLFTASYYTPVNPEKQSPPPRQA